MTDRYPVEETCDYAWGCENPDHPKGESRYCPLPEDDGTMPNNVAELAGHVVGRRIVSAQKEKVQTGRWYGESECFVITLDDGSRVALVDSCDCCAYTTLENFLLHPELVDHVITGVGTTGGYERWHIYADLGDVLELDVSWSPGNPFYYGYGFDFVVLPVDE
ncbi:hypothetical protein SEA_KASHFLOW_105 [Mycobacterium phage KashFlow]|nr:hypothetical protein SEA_KASHFLOW_105 [Mycobacterium phage KashFlow]